MRFPAGDHQAEIDKVQSEVSKNRPPFVRAGMIAAIAVSLDDLSLAASGGLRRRSERLPKKTWQCDTAPFLPFSRPFPTSH